MRPIVTLTLNPAIDASCQADEVGPVRKIRTFDERYDPGGGGINVARVAGRRGRWPDYRCSGEAGSGVPPAAVTRPQSPCADGGVPNR
jgi:hypothetical protein